MTRLVVNVLFAFLVASASADPIALFNTGMDSNGNPLPSGSPDPGYSLTLLGTSQELTAYVVVDIPWNWIGNGVNSKWISPSPDT